jgi:hypothetical protein
MWFLPGDLQVLLFPDSMDWLETDVLTRSSQHRGHAPIAEARSSRREVA